MSVMWQGLPLAVDQEREAREQELNSCRIRVSQSSSVGNGELERHMVPTAPGVCLSVGGCRSRSWRSTCGRGPRRMT